MPNGSSTGVVEFDDNSTRFSKKLSRIWFHSYYTFHIWKRTLRFLFESVASLSLVSCHMNHVWKNVLNGGSSVCVVNPLLLRLISFKPWWYKHFLWLYFILCARLTSDAKWLSIFKRCVCCLYNFCTTTIFGMKFDRPFYSRLNQSARLWKSLA